MNTYRIIQETINNALKYADPKIINIDLNTTSEGLSVTIQDDGKGFDINDVSLGNGLNNMKKRASDIEAELSIDSTLGTGTTITLKLKRNDENTSNDV